MALFSGKKMFAKILKRICIWGISLFFGFAQDKIPPEVATLTIGGALEGAANYIKVKVGGNW